MALSQHSSFGICAGPGGIAFSLRRASGVFFGGGPFASWFLGFVRSREYRRSTDFQLIPVRGSAPSSSSLQQQHFTADSSSSWDAVSIAAISCSERVLHLPCARIGALILIIYCTHIHSQTNKMA